MMQTADDIGHYEGLVHSTAVRYAPILADEELDDIKQLLRIKVWKSRLAYSPSRVTQATERAEERWVFSCLANYVKDLLKQQSRLNERRGGGQVYIEDQSTGGSSQQRLDRFELANGLVVDDDQVYAVVEEEKVELPSTLTLLEQRIVALLLLGEFTQPEMAALLGVSVQRVKKGQAAIREKMLDWRPSAPLAVALAA